VVSPSSVQQDEVEKVAAYDVLGAREYALFTPGENGPSILKGYRLGQYINVILIVPVPFWGWTRTAQVKLPVPVALLKSPVPPVIVNAPVSRSILGSAVGQIVSEVVERKIVFLPFWVVSAKFSDWIAHPSGLTLSTVPTSEYVIVPKLCEPECAIPSTLKEFDDAHGPGHE
jgi:hypothetical protein